MQHETSHDVYLLLRNARNCWRVRETAVYCRSLQLRCMTKNSRRSYVSYLAKFPAAPCLNTPLVQTPVITEMSLSRLMGSETSCSETKGALSHERI